MALQIRHNLSSRSHALTITVATGQKFLVSLLIGTHNHKNAATLLIQMNVDANTIGSEVEIPFLTRMPPALTSIFLLTSRFLPNDVRRRQSLCHLASDQGEGFHESLSKHFRSHISLPSALSPARYISVTETVECPSASLTAYTSFVC